MSAPELHVILEAVSTTKRSAGIHSTTAIRGMRTIEPVASWYKNLVPLVHILAAIDVPTADITWLNGVQTWFIASAEERISASC